MMFEPVQSLFSENVILYLQGHGSLFFDFLFLAVTNLFSEPGLMLLASVIFWCFDRKMGIRLMYIGLFSAFASIFAKSFFALPRPPDYLHKIEETGFGFPSGHALASAGFWGYLAGRVKNPCVIISGAAAILAVSLSRVYLGVHYAGDVVGGILFGFSIAFISLRTEIHILNILQRLDKKAKYSVVLLIPGILIAIAAAQRESLETGMVMAGIGAGYLLEEDLIRFEDAKNNNQRVRRFFAGVLILGSVYTAANLLFFDSFILKYAGLGLTSTFIAPWIFTRMET